MGNMTFFSTHHEQARLETAALEGAGIAPGDERPKFENRRNQRGAARPSADFNSDIRVSLLAVAEVMPQRPVSHNVQHGGGAQAQQGHKQESGFAHDRLRGEIFAYCSAAK